MEKIRDELRALRRGDLLIIAERAAELVPREMLDALLGDYVQLDALATPPEALPTSLLEETRKFHTESLGGRYFESFPVNSRNCTEHSRGTEAFIAEFHRLLGKCVQAVGTEAHGTVREAFELLFRILTCINEAQDDVLFFADEGGSREVGVACAGYYQPIFGVWRRRFLPRNSPEPWTISSRPLPSTTGHGT
jgi:hypothetical protein